jgi:hypothetical protein
MYHLDYPWRQFSLTRWIFRWNQQILLCISNNLMKMIFAIIFAQSPAAIAFRKGSRRIFIISKRFFIEASKTHRSHMSIVHYFCMKYNRIGYSIWPPMQHCNIPRFSPSILRHSGICRSADQAMCNVEYMYFTSFVQLNIVLHHCKMDSATVAQKFFLVEDRRSRNYVSQYVWIMIMCNGQNRNDEYLNLKKNKKSSRRKLR